MYSPTNRPSAMRVSETVYTIPVVVHIIEKDSNPLMTDEQVNALILNLNNAYGGTGFFQGSSDIKVRFELAKWDELCNATTGITRYNASGNATYVSEGAMGKGVTWEQIESMVSWRKSMYMNVWIVHKMGNGSDGIGGMGNGLMGPADKMLRPNDGIAPHEVAHYLGLDHPFPAAKAGEDCACGDGDGLVDTPSLMSFGIGSVCSHEWGCSDQAKALINPCTNAPYGDVQSNMMNYLNVGCARLFTSDQKKLMRGILESYHKTLLTSPALNAIKPVQSASLEGEDSFCTSGPDFPRIVAKCVCGTVSSITRDGATITETNLSNTRPVLPVGQSVIWNYTLTCSNGLQATKAVRFYNPGVSNIRTNCASSTTYQVSFENNGGFQVSSSAGRVSGNTVVDVPNESLVVLTVSDSAGCSNEHAVVRPCCAMGTATQMACIPTADNGQGGFFGIDRFSFASIDSTSSNSRIDGGNYIDKSCVSIAQVKAGDKVAVTVKGHHTNRHYVKVYIDFDNNGVFADDATPSELVFSARTAGDANNSVTGMVTIPETVIRHVPLRLRVLGDFSAASGACRIQGLVQGETNYGSGQIEDYAVVISNPLPVNLISFSGQIAEQAALLEWKTTDERNSKGFEVQRSSNARSFETIGFVPSHQDITGVAEYKFIDQYVKSLNGYYYRLKQVDFDGKSEFSKVIHVRDSQLTASIYVAPNPVSGRQFRLTLPSGDSHEIDLIASDGIRVPIRIVKEGNSSQVLVEMKENLSPGLYLVRAVNQQNHLEHSVKIIIP